MKRILLLFLLTAVINCVKSQTTHVVEESGLTFSPATLTIQVGDSVRFNGTSSHPVAQVSESTWKNSGNTKLAGGFSFPSGKGIVGFPEADTVYYVCTVHASLGMKGKIIVGTATAVNNPQAASFSVYPVPLKGSTLKLRYDGNKGDPFTVKVFNVAGVLQLSQNLVFGGEEASVDCSTLPSGVYIVRLQDAAGIMNARFVKE